MRSMRMTISNMLFYPPSKGEAWSKTKAHVSIINDLIRFQKWGVANPSQQVVLSVPKSNPKFSLLVHRCGVLMGFSFVPYQESNYFAVVLAYTRETPQNPTGGIVRRLGALYKDAPIPTPGRVKFNPNRWMTLNTKIPAPVNPLANNPYADMGYAPIRWSRIPSYMNTLLRNPPPWIPFQYIH